MPIPRSVTPALRLQGDFVVRSMMDAHTMFTPEPLKSSSGGLANTRSTLVNPRVRMARAGRTRPTILQFVR